MDTFQHCLVRLMSLLFCTSLHTTSDLPGEHLPVIDLEGMSTDSAASFVCTDVDGGATVVHLGAMLLGAIAKCIRNC